MTDIPTLDNLQEELDKLKGKLQEAQDADIPKGLPYVIVRTYSAGVHAGFLESRKGQEVVLRNSRRLYYWDGAFTLSKLALDGTSKPSQCKFSVEVDHIELLEAIEIIRTTTRAQKNLRGVVAHDPS